MSCYVDTKIKSGKIVLPADFNIVVSENLNKYGYGIGTNYWDTKEIEDDNDGIAFFMQDENIMVVLGECSYPFQKVEGRWVMDKVKFTTNGSYGVDWMAELANKFANEVTFLNINEFGEIWDVIVENKTITLKDV